MIYDTKKLRRLEVKLAVDEGTASALSDLCNEEQRARDALLADTRSRPRWQPGDPRLRFSLTELCALPADDLAELGLDKLSLRRGADAEARLASLREQQAEHAKRTAALKTLVRRLQAWAGTEGAAEGIAPAGLGLTVNRGAAL